MAHEAKVTSIEALDRFRASLIIFMTKARRTIDETREELRRTRLWLQHEQRTHWENEIRTRRRKLDQANAELFSAKLSKFTDSTSRQKAMVRHAKDALVEAEEKLRNTKKWNQTFESTADPVVKGIEGLHHSLDDDLPRAVAYLSQAQRALESYAGHPPSASLPAPESAEPPPQP